MSIPEGKYSFSEFHKNFLPLIENDIPGWATKIGVSAQNIRDSWFKGGYPGVDKIIKFLEISGVSPSHLLLGKECEGCNNGPHFSGLARKKYMSLYTITTRVNRAARQDRKPAVMATIVKCMMEAEIVDQKNEV